MIHNADVYHMEQPNKPVLLYITWIDGRPIKIFTTFVCCYGSKRFFTTVLIYLSVILLYLNVHDTLLSTAIYNKCMSQVHQVQSVIQDNTCICGAFTISSDRHHVKFTQGELSSALISYIWNSFIL